MSTTQAQPDPTDPVTLHHVALYVSDLDRTRAFYLADPDGHILELLCRLDQPVADQRRAELAASGEGVPVAPEATCQQSPVGPPKAQSAH
jgi:catechol-2,3-dioxygenase